MAPAKLYGKSAGGLHVNVCGLTIEMPARAHAYGRLVNTQEVIGAHDVVQRFHFQHHMLQSGRLAWHAWRESEAVMARVAAQEAQANVVVDVYPITQPEAQYASIKIMRPLGILDREQYVPQTYDVKIAGIAHRLFVNLEAIRQSQTMPIGVLELDEVSHMPFKTFLATTRTPIDAADFELRLPLGKFVGPANVQSNVVKNWFRSCARGDSVLIVIRPNIRDPSVGRRCGGKSQHITGKIREPFAIRHANADLHNLLDRCHGRPSFRSNCDGQ